MGNFASSASVEFDALPVVAAVSWSHLMYAWGRVNEVVGPSELRAPKLVGPNTTRAQFAEVWTDATGAADGTWRDPPLAIFRAFDPGLRNSAPLHPMFLLVGLFAAGSLSAYARFEWLLKELLGAVSEEDESVHEAALIAIIPVINKALLAVGAVSRACAPIEARELAASVLAAACSAKGGVTSCSTMLLVRWLQTPSAVHTFVTRFQMSPEAFTAQAKAGTLPELVAEPNGIRSGLSKHKKVPLKGRGGQVAKAGEGKIELDLSKRQRALTRKPALVEFSRASAASVEELLKLKKAFYHAASKDGLVDCEGFVETMTEFFPGLARVDASGESALALLFSSFDEDGSGLIDIREFMIGAAKLVNCSVGQKTDLLIGVLDTDSSGFVSVQELARFMPDSGEELQQVLQHAHGLVATLVTKTPGIVTESEFVAFLLSKPLLPSAFAAVGHSAALALVRKALDEIAILLLHQIATDEKGGAAPAGRPPVVARVGPGRRASVMEVYVPALLGRRGSVMGAAALGRRGSVSNGAIDPPPTGRRSSVARRGSVPMEAGAPAGRRGSVVATSPAAPVPPALPTPFTFASLLNFWSQRLMASTMAARKSAANQGKPGPAPGRLLPRAGAKEVAIAEPQLLLHTQCTVEQLETLFLAAFNLDSIRPNPASVHGYRGAVRFAFEALAAGLASGNDLSSGNTGLRTGAALRVAEIDAKGGATPPTVAMALAAGVSLSDLSLPTRDVLHMLGLALTTTQEELALVLYRQADKNGDGRLTTSELQSFIATQAGSCNVAVTRALQLLAALDTDGDGSLSVAEIKSGLAVTPALYEVFGMLLNGSGELQETAIEYVASPSPVRGAGGDEEPPSVRTGRASTEASGQPAVPATFLFEVRKEDKSLTLAQQLAKRRRAYANSSMRIEQDLTRLGGRMGTLLNTAAPQIDEVTREIGLVLQRSRASIATTKKLIYHLQSPAPPPEAVRERSPSPRRRPGTAGVASRPGTAGATTRPGTAMQLAWTGGRQMDRDGVPLPETQMRWN